MKILFLLGMILAMPSIASLTEEQLKAIEQRLNEQTNGHTGLLYVQGTLTEGTCRMSMESDWQEVDLGNTVLADIKTYGQTGHSTSIKIFLEDCPGQITNVTNSATLTQTRVAGGTIYQARFIAVADETNPNLIKVKGASGIGLQLRDDQGREVKLSQRGYPILLAPGQNEVTFSLQPVRTRSEFVAGAYHAIINFSMIYQ